MNIFTPLIFKFYMRLKAIILAGTIFALKLSQLFQKEDSSQE
jgi:hypothetical protein